MTIDEAIKHCEEVAEQKERAGSFWRKGSKNYESCLKCAEEHKQLARWLEELKALKQQPSEDCISRKDIGLTNLEILMCDGDYKEALKMLLDKIKKAPPVNPQPKTDVLDKIKARIEQKCCITVGGEPAITLYDVFQIIDEYKKSEVDNADSN